MYLLIFNFNFKLLSIHLLLWFDSFDTLFKPLAYVGFSNPFLLCIRLILLLLNNNLEKRFTYIVVFITVQKVFSHMNRQDVRQQLPIVSLQMLHILLFLWKAKNPGFVLRFVKLNFKSPYLLLGASTRSPGDTSPPFVDRAILKLLRSPQRLSRWCTSASEFQCWNLISVNNEGIVRTRVRS